MSTSLRSAFDVAEFIGEHEGVECAAAFDEMHEALGWHEADRIWMDGCNLFDTLAGCEFA